MSKKTGEVHTADFALENERSWLRVRAENLKSLAALVTARSPVLWGLLAASIDRSLWVKVFHSLMMNVCRKSAAKLEPNNIKNSCKPYGIRLTAIMAHHWGVFRKLFVDFVDFCALTNFLHLRLLAFLTGQKIYIDFVVSQKFLSAAAARVFCVCAQVKV